MLLGTCKPLIGVVHLPPLPGSPGYKRRPFPFPHGSRMDINDIVEYAVGEAKRYVDAGFDAIIVENYGDKPYKQKVGKGEVTAMTRIALEVKRAVNVPVGVNLLRNSPYESLYVAHIAGLAFTRVNSLCETRYSVEGVIQPSMHDLAKAIMELNIMDDLLKEKIVVLADIDVKHSYPVLREYSPETIIRDCIKRSGFPIHALIVTGESTGIEPSLDYAERMSNAIHDQGLNVVIGSGVRTENITRFWNLADGFIVGTSVKLGEETENMVSMEKASALAKLVKRYRETWSCKS